MITLSKKDLNSVGNGRSLYMIMCTGKKLYCNITEGEFVAENSRDTTYYSVVGFNKDTA